MKPVLSVLFFSIIGSQLLAQSIFDKKYDRSLIRKWYDGRYYTTDGKRIDGMISYITQSNKLLGSGDHIFYKLNKEADKRKISSDSLQSFVIGPDSFVVSYFNDLKKTPFLKVMIDRPIKLYLSTVKSQQNYVNNGMMTGGGVGMVTGMGFANDHESFYYGENKDALTEVDRKTFIEVMSKIMADKPDVVDAIKKKEYRFASLKALVDYYISGKKPIIEQKKDDAY